MDVLQYVCAEQMDALKQNRKDVTDSHTQTLRPWRISVCSCSPAANELDLLQTNQNDTHTHTHTLCPSVGSQ